MNPQIQVWSFFLAKALPLPSLINTLTDLGIGVPTADTTPVSKSLREALSASTSGNMMRGTGIEKPVGVRGGVRGYKVGLRRCHDTGLFISQVVSTCSLRAMHN
ncbi:hypothetical protein TIFTF001_017782 [Ficus carica]|uniref:Uncharacterized protein n=1 Tax=Ficus carica TaxID=3494 RepID=A0AA88DA42_FICCA|nr:hypothetical protein TIFTF001_017782 [Ficus carica]